MFVKRHRQAGFSLLELLVAFSIMALSLGLLYRVAGGSARNVSDVTQSQQAAWLAESILSSRSSVLEDGWSEEGESAGFQWQVRSNVFNSGINIPQAVPLHVPQSHQSEPKSPDQKARHGFLKSRKRLQEKGPSVDRRSWLWRFHLSCQKHH